MKIGIDARCLGPEETGPGIYTRSLIDQLSLLAPESTFVLYCGENQPMPRLPGGSNVSARALRRPLGRKVGNLYFEQCSLPRAVRRDGCDLLWSPAFVLPLEKNSAQVVTIHDAIPLLFPEEETAVRRLVYHRLLRVNARQADRILTVSDNSARDLIRLLRVDARKVRAVPNGVDPAFSPTEPGDDRVDALCAELRIQRPYALCAAGLLPRKNPHGLLEAFGRLSADSRRSPLRTLVFTGKTDHGGNRTYVENLRRRARQLGVSDQVCFAGFRPREEMRLLYGGALLSVDPSFYEGFGFPVVESMACGCPVIISDRSSLPEVAGDAALRFDPDSVDDLAHAMERLAADDSLRLRLREHGLQRARRFSWERSAMAILEVFREAVGLPPALRERAA